MPRLKPRRTLDTILHDLPVRSLNTIEERQSLCDYIGYATHSDMRMFVWDIKPLPQDEFVVTGAVSNPFALNALQKAAEECRMACNVSQVKILLYNGMQNEIFGIVTAPESPLMDAVTPSEQLDSALYGNTLLLLQTEEIYTLAHSQNGYVGWVENSTFRPIALHEWVDQWRYERALFLEPYQHDGFSIPQDAELPMLPGQKILLPDGSVLEDLPQSHQMAVSNNQEMRDLLLNKAKTLLGVPYSWGGTSKTGIDCSGFIRYVYSTVGVLLPRDADQQFLLGNICGLPGKLEAVKTGDLLFFFGDSGGIKHVAMAIDPDTFIHASNKPGVTITTWDQEPYLREHFALSKRVLR